MIRFDAAVDKINNLELPWKAALTLDNLGLAVKNFPTGLNQLNATQRKKLLAQFLTLEEHQVSPKPHSKQVSSEYAESPHSTSADRRNSIASVPEASVANSRAVTAGSRRAAALVPGGGNEINLYALPGAYDARDTLAGQLHCDSFNVLDQGDCDSCYAFGVVSAYSARLCMRNRNSLGNVVISAQQLIDCNGGCGGADLLSVFQSLVTSAPVESWCDPYTASPVACSSPVCTTSRTFPALAGSLRVVGGATPAGLRWMMIEVLRRGPGTFTFKVYNDLFGYSSGVYTVAPGSILAGAHAVVMVGWGTDPDSGLDYWVVQNSWAADWGESGYFRIRRGTDESGIESSGLIVPQPAPLTKCSTANCPNNALTLANCSCQCINGFTGPRCSTCGLVCLNGGTRPNSSCTACSCPLGFYGVRCESGVKMAPYASCETSGTPPAVSVNATFGDGFPVVTQGSYFGFLEVGEYGTFNIQNQFYVCGSGFNFNVNSGLCPTTSKALSPAPLAPSEPGHYKLVLVQYIVYDAALGLEYYPAFIDDSATVGFYSVIECNQTSTLAPTLAANNPIATYQAEVAAAAAAAAAQQVVMTARLSAAQSLIQALQAEPAAAVTLPPLSTAYPWIWFGGQAQPVCFRLPPSINMNPKQLVLLASSGAAYSTSLLGPYASPLPLPASGCVNFSVPATVGAGSFTMALEDATSGNYIAGAAFTGDVASISYSSLAYQLGPTGWIQLTVTWSVTPAHATAKDVIKLLDRSGRVVVSFGTAVKGAAVARGSTVFTIHVPPPGAPRYPEGGFAANFYPNNGALWAATAFNWIPWSALGW